METVVDTGGEQDAFYSRACLSPYPLFSFLFPFLFFTFNTAGSLNYFEVYYVYPKNWPRCAFRYLSLFVPEFFPLNHHYTSFPLTFLSQFFCRIFHGLRDENWIEITETRKILFFWKVLEESYADYIWIPLSRLVGFYILLIRRWNFIRVFIG